MLSLYRAKSGVFLSSLYPAQKDTPFLDHVGTMLGVYGAYVGPMLTHVELLGAMLGPYSSYVELMSSQERRVPFKPLPGPKRTRRLDHVGTMLGVYGAYVGPMLIHVGSWRLCWGHIRAMVSLYQAKSGVFLLSLYRAQKEHAVFGPCRDHVGRIWGLCWAYVGPMLGLCWAYVDPC